MSVMSIYGKKHLKVFFFRAKKTLGLNLGIKHQGLGVYQDFSNDDRKVIFDLLTARPNLRSHVFVPMYLYLCVPMYL